MLHVTNGDHAANRIREAGISGEVLPWRDVLHEGPVPAGLDAGALREVRARFLAAQGWGVYEEILSDLAARYAALGAATEVTLWFEHDLYDQLQLVQVLDGLADRTASVSLVQADHYLGPMMSEQVGALYPTRRAVTPEQFALARRAWVAFRAPQPDALPALVQEDLSALPYLGAALRRFLEDLPSVRNGLSRTEQQALEVIATGARDRVGAFRQWQEREEPQWMGDSGFFLQLARLASGRDPLLTEQGGVLAVTERGRAVLDGREDWVRLGSVDRWWGGVHLHGQEIPWRWDPETGSVRVIPSPPA